MDTTLIFAGKPGDNAEADTDFVRARKHFDRAARAFEELIDRLEQDDFSELSDAKRVIQALEKANELLIGAKQKADDRNKKQLGIAHDYAIDFTAARSEIGRRLACLRGAGSAGAVSE